MIIYDKGNYKLEEDYLDIINYLKKNACTSDDDELTPREESVCSQKIDENIEEFSTESSKTHESSSSESKIMSDENKNSDKSSKDSVEA